MRDSLRLKILTPERIFYEEDVKAIITENDIGKLEILPNHIALITSLNPTVTVITDKNGAKRNVFTSTGVLKIRDNKIEMLCEAAEWPEEIDLQRAEEAKKRAEIKLSQKDDTDLKRVEVSLKRAIMRIKAKK